MNTTTKTHGLKVGDILFSSWGYDQTNVNFYRVERTAATMVHLVELIPADTPVADGWSGVVIPTSEVRGKVFRRRVRYSSTLNDWRVDINSYASAKLWDGRPREYTCHA